MTLPTFLGIGSQRSGTTWLHLLLETHPEVYMPTRRKELHFFDWYYDRGLKWYEKFFPTPQQALHYRAIGEMTPNYLVCSSCPERIISVPSISKLLLIVRNPVDRVYSNYNYQAARDNYSESFERFLSLHPEAVQRGFYAQHLKRYLRYFRRDQILALVYECAVADVPKTKETLARFLRIDVDRFAPGVGVKKVHRSYTPKARTAYALGAKLASEFRKWDIDWPVNSAKWLGLDRLFGDAGSPPPMKEETRSHLRELYEDEVRELEELLQIDLECWK